MLKFKPTIAKIRPLKTPTMLALDHFDFYYGPLYGRKWPSIRLGLLGPKKFVAAINRFSQEADVNEDVFKDLGALDLTQILRKGLIKENGNAPVRTGGSVDYSPCMLDASQNDIVVDKITGLEGIGIQISKEEDFIAIPDNLKVYSYDRDVISDYPIPVKDENGIYSWWLLDGASILPVLALDLKKTDKVLDMCSAPGGKSLLILQSGSFDKLTCNEVKMNRLGQLRRALTTYIPDNDPIVEKVILKRKDGSNLENWDDIAIYDKVLVDAQCTTDKISVLEDDGNLFSSSQTEIRLDLPTLQTKLLINALRSVKIGGSVVYSTCTLAPNQNDIVVDNAVAIAQQKYGISVVEKNLALLESRLASSGLYRFNKNCHRGHLVLPFLPSNFGPMYVCKLQRID